MKKNINYIMCKLDRLSAWGIFLTMLIYFVSGYGMTKGIINSGLAATIHNDWLPFFAVTFFIIHTSYAIRLALMRWGIWNIVSKIILFLFYVIFIVGFLYVDVVYNKKDEIKDNSNTQNSAQNIKNEVNEITTTQTPSIQNNTLTNTPTDKIFTSAEIAEYNGKNGQPAYLAVDGIVYDLSEVFKNGYHYGHPAGMDLTDAFYTKHIKSSITKYPTVGMIEK